MADVRAEFLKIDVGCRLLCACSALSAVMLIEHQDRRFGVLRCSDVERDGMFLELAETGSASPLLEIFYSDVDGSFAMRGFDKPLPLAVVEQFIMVARQTLPPLPAA